MFSGIGYLYTVILYQPLLNLLVLTYNLIPGHDIGVTIILLTLLVKAVLYPFSLQTIKAQKSMNELQPKIEELKVKYKDDKEKQAMEMMKIYKEHKINPLSSCLPLLIQLPFLIAIYSVFTAGLKSESLTMLYGFVSNPGSINTLAFGFLDMSKPAWVLAILAAGAQFLQTKMMMNKRPEVKTEGSKDEDMAAIMNKQMLVMMPLMTLIIGWTLPSGLVFYWFLLTLFTAGQQFITLRKKKSLPVEVIG